MNVYINVYKNKNYDSWQKKVRSLLHFYALMFSIRFHPYIQIDLEITRF